MFGRSVVVGGFVVFIAGFVGLGFWQLDRAAQKRALFDAFDAGGESAIATELIVGDAINGRRYSRLELAGKYLSSHQILLDWMTYEGRVGYQVLTPFQSSQSDLWIVVNRGWVIGSADHSELPDVAVGEGDRVIRGRIDALPRPGLRVGRNEVASSAAWPRPLLYPTLEEIETALELPIAQYQLLLGADESDGFVREWRPRTLEPQNHVGYAVQWFAMAAVFSAIGIGLAIKAGAAVTASGDRPS